MLREKLLLPVLDNPFHALAGSPPNTLGIIAFAVLIGLACLVLGEKVAVVTRFFVGFNEIMVTITGWVMEIAPLAIGCIIASIMATLGFQAIASLAWYTTAVLLALGLHMAFLLIVVKGVAGIGPRRFIAGMRDAWLISFSTASSTATLPISIRCVTRNLKVSPKVADFSMPVGATVNMDGSALYEAVAILFVVQVYGGLADVPIELGIGNTLIIAVTAVVTSIGVAAVPSAALITMAIIAGAIGLPLHYIAIIYAVDHLLDMFRTTVNITGDAVGAAVVNAWEEKRLGGTDAAEA
jgi:Na+/H+-dicarboxylate symporter